MKYDQGKVNKKEKKERNNIEILLSFSTVQKNEFDFCCCRVSFSVTLCGRECFYCAMTRQLVFERITLSYDEDFKNLGNDHLHSLKEANNSIV